MARAKRTQRADARRRYRAFQAETIEGAASETEASSAPQPKRAAQIGRGATGNPVPVPGQRYGFGQALRLAYRPIQFRDDFRYIPTLLFRTNAIWPALLLVIVSAGVLAIENDKTSVFFQLAGSILGLSAGGVMPFIPAVLAGFLAPRAAWLAGVIVTLLTILITLVVDRQYFTVNLSPDLLISVLVFSSVYGAAFGAASAWYKRFLSFVMAPSAGRGGSRGRPQQRPAARGSKGPVASRRRP